MFSNSRKELRAWAKSQVPLLWKRRVVIALVIIAVAVLLVFRNFVEMLAVMAFFIVLGIASMMYNRWIKVSLGFELITLGMVVTTVVYGRTAGLIVGLTALFFAFLLTDSIMHSTFISFVGIFAVVFAVPLFGDMGITWLGIWMTLLYDAIIGPGYLVMGSSPWRTLLFVVTHILFNVWVFVFIAPFMFGLVGG